MDGREGASSGGSESASLQSQLQVESPNVSGSSGIEDASCDDDNQRALASLGIGDAVHTDATTAAAINAVDSHANEEATGGWASDGRTKLTTTLEKVAQEVHISQTPLSSEQHDIGEKSSQDLHGGSARIQPMEKDPCHDELTLQTAGVFPSESCDGDILEDKSETDNLTKNTREDTEMLEQQNSDKANIQVSCANKMSEVLYDDNNTLGKNTICGGKVTVECHLALLHNKSSEARSNAISSPMQKRHKCTKHYKEQHEQGRRKDIYINREPYTYALETQHCSLHKSESSVLVQYFLHMFSGYSCSSVKAAGCQGQGCGSATEEA
ncbi:uncharacterized protein LOC119360594 isoform X2 [Triticum dicoccoides]|uniref:uncharacterized protein LOC119360594 isoform X2 n=1 Tax=Triticum dicoccoides TaxID=85692 RepID=UPI000E794901|nr:uncharacterized protein LOC119360594 isoform X2 [Triticum dicoccoides]